MAKSRGFTVFTAEDGRRVCFRQSAFAAAVRQTGQSKMEVFRRIAREMYRDEDRDSVAARIKNWENGCNGPASLEDVRKLERCLGLEKDALLQELEEREPERQREADTGMNKALEAIAASAISAGDLREAVRRGMDRALYDMQQRRAAQELFGCLQDAVTQYYRVSMELLEHTDFWDRIQLPPEEVSYTEYLRRYPDIEELKTAIRRASLFLPRELRKQCEELVYDMLGWGPYSPGEIDPALFSEHILLRQLDEYMRRREKTLEDVDPLVTADFFADKLEEYSDTLNEIFWEYVCD